MLRTSAKVNLALEVLGKRSDGYHELSTVMQAVDLFDRLTVEKAETITLETSDAALPTDDRNLVVRAARLLVNNHAGRSGFGTLPPEPLQVGRTAFLRLAGAPAQPFAN